jgi:alginate O-acetyltransferase complex protein AlgI
MLFNTTQFLLFFVIVFTLYWLLPWQKARVWLLLVASFAFYATWNKWLALLVTGTTIMDYVLARLMDGTATQWRKRAYLLTSLIVNLGLLCYFKYMNFFLDSLRESLQAAGVESALPTLAVILPFGISFYTFEAISYSIDVYRGRVKAERSLSSFMLFILFFPHLVAGPIVRAYDFLPQTHRPKRFDWLRMQLGVEHFLLGMLLKTIGDRMALFVDPVFALPMIPNPLWTLGGTEPKEIQNLLGVPAALSFNTGAVWLAVFAYALQIYCDFCGYSHMALGCAHMLGYKLTRNFNMPYIAASLQDFWHRWHMSLSTWLRDYLYFPLGGSRGTYWQTQRNQLVTMTLGGLWHGANWTFVLWGVAHGVLLGVNRDMRDLCQRKPGLNALLSSWPGRALCMAATFLTVMFLWVFFRAPTFHVATAVFGQMFVPTGGSELLPSPMHYRSLWYIVAVMAVCHALTASGLWKRYAWRMPAPALGFGYAVVLTIALILAPDAGKAFIYFTF